MLALIAIPALLTLGVTLLRLYAELHGWGPALANDEPLFDAANIVRAGRDIIYLVSCSGNRMAPPFSAFTRARRAFCMLASVRS